MSLVLIHNFSSIKPKENSRQPYFCSTSSGGLKSSITRVHNPNYDRASHIPNPAKNDPSDTSNPAYTTECTPIRGSTSDVCSTARENWRRSTRGSVIFRGIFVFVYVKTDDKGGGRARVERM